MKYSVTKVGVLGSGVMGAGIAAWVAGAGIPVVLLDRIPDTLSEDEQKKGLTTDSKAFRNKYAVEGLARVSDTKRGVLLSPEMAGYITPGNFEDSLEMLRECDLIIEVVAEDSKIKQALFERIAPYIGDRTIVATNTSGIPVTDVASVFNDDIRKRFLGMHFFNPPRYMRLLEVIPSSYTSPDVVSFISYFGGEILGKGVVIAKDTPNFIANRIGSYSSAVVLSSMDEFGLSFEDVDSLTGTMLGRPRSATFGTLDMVGLDIQASVSKNLVAAIPEEKENFKLPGFYTELMEKGYLGNKTGQGFYRRIKQTDAKGKRITYVWNTKKNDYVDSKGPSSDFARTMGVERDLGRRLKNVIDSQDKEGRFVWNYLKKLLLYSADKAREIADDYRLIDDAMRWGYNWDMGPFQIWQAIGFEYVAKRMQCEGEKLPGWIAEMLEKQEVLYDSTNTEVTAYPIIEYLNHSSIVDLGDGVLGFDMNSPGNCITDELKEDIEHAVDLLENTPCYKGMVLFNQGNHFLTGADLKTFDKFLKKEDYDSIKKNLESFHNVSKRLKFAKKPIVAAVHDMVLGGGYEFSIACRRIVAHVDSYMGLVEAGVGIIPGGGGLKELLVMGMQDIEKYKYNDHHPVVLKYWTSISTAQVSKNAFHAKSMGYLRPTDRIIMQKANLIDEGKKEALRMSDDGYRQAIPTHIAVAGTSGRAFLMQAIQNMRDGRFISEYDGVIAEKVAYAITGGDVPKGTVLTEDDILELEKQCILELVHNEKTQQRVEAMVKTGRALRN